MRPGKTGQGQSVLNNDSYGEIWPVGWEGRLVTSEVTLLLEPEVKLRGGHGNSKMQKIEMISKPGMKFMEPSSPWL